MLTIHFFEFSPIAENTYVLYNESGECLIIDPGCYHQAEEQQLKSFITSTKLTPKQLLNTHCHLDHVFGNRFVHETWGLPLYLHPAEKIVLDYAAQAGERWNLPFRSYEGPLHYFKGAISSASVKMNCRLLKHPAIHPGMFVSIVKSRPS